MNQATLIHEETLQGPWDRAVRSFKEETDFFHAPISPEIHGLQSVQDLIGRWNQLGLTHLVVIGIGGSSLGGRALVDSLPRHGTGMTVVFSEHPSEEDWATRSKHLEPAKTAIALIAKSGSTYETLALGSRWLGWLGSERIPAQTIAVTSMREGQSDLTRWTTSTGMPTLALAEKMGGRYSVFSPVGLVPLLAHSPASGVAFLNGAAKSRQAWLDTPVHQNPWLILGEKMVADRQDRRVHSQFSYLPRFRSGLEWWTQLWSESLGKSGEGFFPLTGAAPQMQHSILQLLLGGPDQAIVGLLRLQDSSERAPHVAPSIPLPGARTAQLAQISLDDFLDLESAATQDALMTRRRPVWVASFKDLSASTLGAWMHSWCTLTSWLGFRLGVNPFDQPDVEAGKVEIERRLKAKTSA